MMDFLTKLFDPTGFEPRREWPGWNWELVWLHTTCDVLLWLACLSIPLVLGYIALQRRMPLASLVGLFAASFLVLGVTHLLEAVAFQVPVYRLSGAVKVLAVVVTWTTLIVLVPTVPRILARLEERHDWLALPAVIEDDGRVRGYVVGMLAAVLAVLCRLLLDPIVKERHPLLVPLLAVVIVAWRHGFGPAFLTTILALAGVLLGAYPARAFDAARPADQVGAGIFLACGVVCALLGEVQLISRRRAERHLRESLRKQTDLESEMMRRRAAEETLPKLADAVPEIVWIARPDGFHEFFNSRWYLFSGMTEADSIGLGWIAALHPEDRERAAERWAGAIRTGQPYEIEYRLRSADGAYRWFLGRALPQRDRHDKVVRWFGTGTDIDDTKRSAERLEAIVHERTQELITTNSNLRAEIVERTRAEERAEAVTLELRRSNEELEKFAYVASHDLQEPLRKIQAFGDRLRSRFRDQLADQGRDFIDRMLASATRMRRLIDDLLAFSRVTTKGQPFTTVDLNEIARGVVSDLEARIAPSGGRVDIGTLPQIDADPLQMRQLFQNLIANGLKFHKPGESPEVRVDGILESTDAGPMCRLTFTDNGIGFDEIYHDRIFQLFQRLHGRMEYEGTGIGLAVCRKIAERHGGSIGARSRPGEGATFTVVLKAVQTRES